ncbi:ankyrin repeat-containing domain, PGG domain protein [Artemisia annua]|uniref:Ankyrin repeat-containing domain, PGG domain protein n=1 Tax=Artemisia annua TaxID=35608 RepID=A0A2U1QEY0_ARTAN|nr:ankyrin repeat-containing domain, PGG domain protein [Artemisia annua]
MLHPEERRTKVTFQKLNIPNDKRYQTHSPLEDTKDVTDFSPASGDLINSNVCQEHVSVSVWMASVIRMDSSEIDKYDADCVNLADLKERRKYLRIYLPLYEASIRCDWKAAEAILDKNPDLVRCRISENGETALHIAASAKAPKKKVDEFVRNLVGKMEKEDLELVNNNHSTALYLAAAAGNIETVKIMMEAHPTLDMICGGGGDMMPLYAAVLFGHKDVAEYLYENSLFNVWTHDDRSSLVEKCVESDMFDIAIKIVKRYPYLGENILGLLARKTESFHEKKSSNTESDKAFHENKSSDTESNIIRRTIKSDDPIDALPLLKILCEDIVRLPKDVMDGILIGPRDSIKSGFGRIVQTIQLKQLIVSHLDNLGEKTQTIMEGREKVSKLKDLVSKYVVDMHSETQSLIKKENTTDECQALELQKLISEFIVKLHHETKKMLANPDVNDEDKARRLQNLISNHIKKIRAETEIKMHAETHSSRVMFIAAEVGNTNFLLELIRRRPDLIWQVDDNGLSIFHVAVKHRHEGIYNLLYEIGSMKDMVFPKPNSVSL